MRTGLGIVESMAQLNTHLQRERGIQLSVGLGILIGMVIVGDMRAGGARDSPILGELLNLSAWLQEIAEPDTMVISGATYRLAAVKEVAQLGATLGRGFPAVGCRGPHPWDLDVGAAHPQKAAHGYGRPSETGPRPTRPRSPPRPVSAPLPHQSPLRLKDYTSSKINLTIPLIAAYHTCPPVGPRRAR